MQTRSGKISLVGTISFIAAVLYLFLPIYSANVENFNFSCNLVTLLIKGGFTNASFVSVIQYFLPFVLFIVTGCFAMGGKLRHKFVVFALTILTIGSLLWVMLDLSLVENLLSKFDFGAVTLKDGTGVGLIVSILIALWCGVTAFLAKGRNTF